MSILIIFLYLVRTDYFLNLDLNGLRVIFLLKRFVASRLFFHMSYCIKTREIEKVSIGYIKNLKDMQSPVAIFGTGAYLMHFMAVSPLKGCNILHLVDNNEMKQGKLIYGYKIEAPECLDSFEGVVLIASMLYADEIKQQLSKIKKFDDIYAL